MAYQEDMALARDVLKQLRYVEYLDNVLYYDRWSGGCPADGFAYGQQVNEYVLGRGDALLKEPETRAALERLRSGDDGELANDLDRGVVRWLGRRIDESDKVPAELQAELSRANAEGQRAWAVCRANADFKGFIPELRRQFDIQRRIADAIDPDARPYDVIMARCDPSYSCDQVDAVFDQVKQGIKDILDTSGDALAAIDMSPVDKVEAFKDESDLNGLIKEISPFLGASMDQTTQWRLRHPVTVCTGPRDGRPSTYLPGTTTMLQAARCMCHETGHAMYGCSSSQEVVDSSLWGGIEGFMHESQSRFYENHVFRSREFWEGFAPIAEKYLPGLKGADLDAFCRALNKPNPGVSRLAADELTYPLHIVIRHEIERDYFDGKLPLEDIEDAWNAKYEDYLGVRPKDASEGVLADVHWASGCVGYFFSYALGDLYAAQFEHALRHDVPDAFDRLAAGDSSAIHDWLTEHVWQHGQTYTAPETLRKATGEDLNVTYYVDYLKGRFSA